MDMLPPVMKWMDDLGTWPKLVSAAVQYLGVREIKGSANNPVIMDMAKGLGVADIYTSDDQQPWCALFMNHLFRITGKPIDLYPHDRYDLLRAKRVALNFDYVLKHQWRFGDVVILNRDKGGHCFIAIAGTKDETKIIGIGGNQSNCVNFGEFDTDRIIAVKRFYATAMPASAKQYVMESLGEVSTNEI